MERADPVPLAVVLNGLLERLTDLVLCSRCLTRGVRRRVPQVLSPRHRPRTLCTDCRREQAGDC